MYGNISIQVFFHLKFLQSITYNTADTTYHLSSMLPVVPRVMNAYLFLCPSIVFKMIVYLLRR
jgi:hypothetical protein